MNPHLSLVRTYHDALSIRQAEPGTAGHLSDMDIILHQAFLMESGSTICKALKSGEMTDILAGLTDLAYYALSGIALSGFDVIEKPVDWRHDGFVLSVMKLLSEKIDRCTNGHAENYSALYCLCVHLSKAFLNADFDGAFRRVHDNNIARISELHQADLTTRMQLPTAPDLSEYMYE